MAPSQISRVVIEEVSPCVDGGKYAVKRVVGEAVEVSAAIYADGRQEILANLHWRESSSSDWEKTPMVFYQNDTWKAQFVVHQTGFYEYKITAWINAYKTWKSDLVKRKNSKQDLTVEEGIGKAMIQKAAKKASKEDKALLLLYLARIEKEKEPFALFFDPALSHVMDSYLTDPLATSDVLVPVFFQRKRALFSSWYEIFPRSFGGFKEVSKLLPKIAKMGFNVLYFPPIHPIGKTNRKGKNNSLLAKGDDPGSPWAIGSEEGGHDAIHSELGGVEEFCSLIAKASLNGIEIAIDLAFQCSPDHPWIKSYPDWFNKRPDGSWQFAENPPKKYEDIVPLNFGTKHWQDLWNEMLRIVYFWMEKGIRIFRVDNPHTKPFAFWEQLIQNARKKDPEVIFLAESFTRPHLMYRLAKIGFDQSYTYFTWRNTKQELMQYLNELTDSSTRDFLRPNFWPNTPDILSEYLQHGGRAAFSARLVLAATLSSNYGIYGPAYELLVSSALPEKEEYLNSEKYEKIAWDVEDKNSICELVVQLNRIRNEQKAFQTTWNLRFCTVDNEMLIAYLKEDSFLIVVNLDPFSTQSGSVQLPLADIGIKEGTPFLLCDLLNENKYFRSGKSLFIELSPEKAAAHIFRIYPRIKSEQDFDYFI